MRKMGCVLMVMLLLTSGCSQDGSNDSKYTGTVEATQFDVTTDISGLIKEIYVSEGDLVEIGKIVARLDDTNLNYSALQQESAYYSKQEQLNDILKGSKEAEIDIAEQELLKGQIALETVKEQLEYTLEIYNNTKKLFDEGAVNEQQLKDRKLQLNQAESSVKNAEKNITLLLSKLNLLKEGSTDEQIKSNEYNVEQWKYAYEQAMSQKEKANVTALQKGIVLYKYYQEGEFLPLGAPIVTLINPEDLWLKIYVPEKDLHLVTVGTKVPLLSDGVEEQEITGEIVFISPKAEFTPSNVTTKEDRHNRVHEIKIKVVEGGAFLNSGMVLDVELGKENIN